MKKLITALLIAVMIFGITACGGSTKEAYTGKYLAYSAEMFGISMTADELFGGEDKFTVELRGGNKIIIDTEGEKGSGKYTLSGENISIEVDKITMSGKLVDNMLYIDNMLGVEGMKIIFYKKGTTPAEAPVAEIPAVPAAASVEEPAVPVETVVTNHESKAEETPSESVAADDNGVLGNYYGFAYHTNAGQNFFFEEKMPIWAYLGPDTDGDIFFEIYREEDRNSESVVASMWVIMTDNTMVPFIGEENAWIYHLYLTEADTTPLTVEITDNTLTMRYPYHEVDNGVEYSTDLIFYLLKEGTPWVEPDF